MFDIQPSLTALVSALESEKFKMEEIVSAYLTTSKSSFSGRSLEQALSKKYGSVTITSVGAVTDVNNDVLPYFETLPDDQQRRILLFAVCNFCYFSVRARDRILAISIAFDRHIAQQVVGEK